MVACRYEISLRVFNSIAHEWAQRISSRAHALFSIYFDITLSPLLHFFERVFPIIRIFKEHNIIFLIRYAPFHSILNT